jgi:5-methylcytosine-specific restriction endonuclease McrA
LEIPKYHYYGEGHKKRKHSNEMIFCENSKYPRHKLKERIIKENLIEYSCSICGNNGNWNEKKLPLHIDHQNGKNNDNRLENLRFLCPNCHSQTDTYSGKNKKNLLGATVA